MKIFKYHKLCRNCEAYDGLNHMSTDNNNDSVKDLSNYQLSNYIQNAFLSRKNCEICGSNNYSIFNIQVDDEYHWNYDIKAQEFETNNIPYYFISLYRENNQILAGIKSRSANIFLRDFEDYTFNFINSLDRNLFGFMETGRMEIGLTLKDTEVKIETFMFAGLTYEEVNMGLEHIFAQLYKQNN